MSLVDAPNQPGVQEDVRDPVEECMHEPTCASRTVQFDERVEVSRGLDIVEATYTQIMSVTVKCERDGTPRPLHEDHVPRVAVDATFAAQRRDFAKYAYNLNDRFTSYVARGEEELVRLRRELHVTVAELHLLMRASGNQQLNAALKRASDGKVVNDTESLAIESELHLAKSTADRRCLKAKRAHEQLRSAEMQLASTTATLEESRASRTSRDILGCEIGVTLNEFSEHLRHLGETMKTNTRFRRPGELSRESR